ncbi:MAG: hypothetical protein QM775_23070 [Pirellulales bacterium]
MNLFGKILVALNLVMSLVFMGFAVAVYSTHTNCAQSRATRPEGRVSAAKAGRVGLPTPEEDR